MDFDALLLKASARELGGKVYGHTGATTTNCCRAVELILVELYGDAVRSSEHPALMVMDPSQPFSPVDACVRLGIGERVDEPLAGRWHVVQGWRTLNEYGHVPNPSPSPNGHTFLFYRCRPPEVGGDILVNANTSRPWVRDINWGDAKAPYHAGVELCVLKESA